jgi:hypothetical protein
MSTAALSRTRSPGARRSCRQQAIERPKDAPSKFPEAIRATSPTGCQLFGEPPQATVALVAPGIHQAHFDSLPHGTSGLTHVPAIEESTAGGEARDLDEAKMPWVKTIDRRREVAHAR